MGNPLSLSGERFEYLVVIGKSKKRTKDNRILWDCRCDCGEIVSVRSDHLISGHTRSCGCYSCKSAAKRTVRDLVGQKIGRLTVIQDSGQRAHNGGVLWMCQCDCGTKINVRSDSLISEHTKSCGCYNRERAAELGKKDLIGQRFGRLTAVRESKKRYNGCTMWVCQCTCGRETVVLCSSLINGNTRSCGCLQRERASEKCGNKHPNWRGGKSFEPYPPTFNKQFKRKIRRHDNYTCVHCGEWGNIVHHIDYNKKNTTPENCITLCRSCHSKTNFNRNYWQVRLTEIMRNHLGETIA